MRVYFPFAQSEMAEDERLRITSIIAYYPTDQIDSILLIGFADSTGNTRANLRLSKKRCKSVEKYLHRELNIEIEATIIPEGERDVGSVENNRRVDVLLYFDPKESTTDSVFSQGLDQEPKSETPVNELCREIEYRVLRNCFVSKTSRRGKVDYIIETELPEIKNKELYYAIKDDKGDEKLKRIRWKERYTGKLWWKKKRFITHIPAEAMDYAKIFSLSEPPCKACQWVVGSGNDTIDIPIAYHLNIDTFVMRNLQISSIFLNPNKFKARVPRQYVDTTKIYYHGYNQNRIIEWSQKWGKWRDDYSFTKLDRINRSNFIANITTMQPYCPKKPKWSTGEFHAYYMQCGTRNMVYDSLDFVFNIELGAQYFQNNFRSFAGIRLDKNFYRHQVGASVTYTDRSEIRASFRFKEEIATLPFSALSPVSIWEQPSATLKPKANYFTKFYGATELITLWKDDFNSLFQTLVAGFEFKRSKRGRTVPFFYIHSGMAVDYWSTSSFTPKLYAEAAFSINISQPVNRYWRRIQSAKKARLHH